MGSWLIPGVERRGLKVEDGGLMISIDLQVYI